jgi:hypothetical protein
MCKKTNFFAFRMGKNMNIFDNNEDYDESG